MRARDGLSEVSNMLPRVLSPLKARELTLFPALNIYHSNLLEAHQESN